MPLPSSFESSVLIVIDLQKAFQSPDFIGRQFSSTWESLGSNVTSILALFRSHNLPIIHVHHLGKDPEDSFYEGNTTNVQPLDFAAPLPDEPIVQKHTSSAFKGQVAHPSSLKGKTLVDLLSSHPAHKAKKIDNLIIVGMSSVHCVSSAARAATDEGYKVWVVEDACGTFPVWIYGEKMKGKGDWRDGNAWSAMTVHNVEMSLIDGEFAEVVSAKSVLDEGEKLKK
ncbi:Isochorismatase hydrolase [Atractiella rhizophila]|nr:Isochorismatase hydrolase [Atractiella rhizophila]KAH8925167.1 Isochorismatase hydrolase [Atractiella rhizophila]